MFNSFTKVNKIILQKLGFYIEKIPQLLYQDSVLMFLARAADSANGFLLSMMIVRLFGLPGAGTYSIASIAVTAYALFGTFGITYLFAKSANPIAQLNTLGLCVSILIIPLSIPFSYLLGWAASSVEEEVMTIILLSYGGIFFAHTKILTALQVLQGRVSEGLILPLSSFFGIIFATYFSWSYVSFALILGLIRLVGFICAFTLLPHQRISLKQVVDQIMSGVKYISSDSINLLSDQLPILISSFLISRQELGLFGLCRQSLTLSQTPIWSFMSSKYPSIVENPGVSLENMPSEMLKFGAITGLVVSIISLPIGFLVYKSNEFIFLSFLLMFLNPYRYLLYFYDVYLKAIGAINQCNFATFIRLCASLVILPVSLWLGGAYGGVIGTNFNTVLAVMTTRRFTTARLS